MRLPLRPIVAAVVLLVALAGPSEARAQGGTAVATLQVGVRVVRSCSINADSSAVVDAASSSVRVVCGRSALRALRVSTAPDPDVAPLVTGPQRLAGGELLFIVPPTVLITLDF